MSKISLHNERKDFMKSLRKALYLAITAAALTVSLCIGASAARLTDINGHWAKKYIEYGVDKGYINGYTDGTFKPDGTVTRAEFSKMINNAVKISSRKDSTFSDVSRFDWYYGEVQKAVYAGYVSGYSDGTFRPKNLISRQEAAVILYRISVPTNDTFELRKFTDNSSIADWARDAVSSVAAKGYITGDEKSRFLPAANLTRAQAAKLIYEFVENENVYNGDLTVKGGSATFSEILFTDNIVYNSKLSDAEIRFNNCRILGSVTIDGDSVETSFYSTSAVNMNVGGSDNTVKLDRNSAVSGLTKLSSPAELDGDGFAAVELSGSDLYGGTVVLDGNFPVINVNKSAIIKLSGTADKINVSGKSNLVIQDGNIKELEIGSDCAGATVTLSKNVTVDSANVKSKVSFEGTGRIKSAYNAVSGITYETKPEKLTGKTNDDSSDNTADGSLSSPVITPANAKTKVSTTPSITVSFSKAVYNSNGDSLTTTYIKNHVKLRRSSKTGTSVSYTVTSTSTRSFTIKPISDLSENTKYYLVIDAKTLYNSNDDTNSEIVSYFTTGSDSSDDGDTSADIKFSPKRAATDVEQTAEIKITFSSAIKRQNSSTAVNSTYISSGAVELRKGSSSGANVDFNAEINSTKRVITITPAENLEANTKYYVIINSGYFTDSSGTKISKTSSYFTTSNTLIPTVSPVNASTGVSTMPEIKLEFDEALTRTNGTALSSAYLMASVIELRKSSSTGTQVNFSATISNDKKVITVVPDEELAKSTKYYVIVNEGTLKGSVGKAINEKYSFYFTTAAAMAPVVTPSSGKTGVSTSTDITLTFSDPLYTAGTTSLTRVPITAEYIKKNEVVLLRRSTATGAVIACDVSVSNDRRTITLSPKTELLSDFRYYVVLKNKTLYNESGKYNSASSTYFSTSSVLIPEFTPADGTDDVDVKSKIQIMFGEYVYRPNMSALTTTYLANNVIELHKNNENGESVGFSVTMSSDKRTFTVKPDDYLDGNTDYCIVIVEGSLSDSKENLNPKASATFTTGASVNKDVTFTPENKATGISTNTNIAITFESKVYRYGGGTVTKTYITDNIKLRKGSSSGTVVSYTAAISTDGKTITLTPGTELDKATNYYVVLPSNKFQYADDTKVTGKTIYFKTNDGVPTLTKFTLGNVTAASASFSATSDTGGTLILTATSSGNPTVTKEFPITAGTAKTVVLTGLNPKTSYTVKAYVESASGTKSASLSQNITTPLAFEMNVGDAADTSVEIDFTAYADGKLTLKYKNSSTGKTVTRLTNVLMREGTDKSVTIDELNPETQYEIIAEFVCNDGDGEKISLTENILTESAKDYLAIESLIITAADGSQYEAVVNGTLAAAVIDSTDSIKVQVTSSATTLKINGKTVKNGALSESIAVTGESLNVPITLTHGSQTRNYMLSISIG